MTLDDDNKFDIYCGQAAAHAIVVATFYHFQHFNISSLNFFQFSIFDFLFFVFAFFCRYL